MLGSAAPASAWDIPLDLFADVDATADGAAVDAVTDQVQADTAVNAEAEDLGEAQVEADTSHSLHGQFYTLLD